MYIRFFLIVCILNGALVTHGITFNSTLDKFAEIDIQITKDIPTPTAFQLHKFDLTNEIAQYSFLINERNNIWLWEKLFYKFTATPTFVLPKDRITFPQVIHNNQMSIELSADKIRELMGNITQVYVIIRQRTYAFVSSVQNITFFAHSVLMEQFLTLDAIVTIEASGLIAPSQFGKVPASFQDRYPIATGSAIT